MKRNMIFSKTNINPILKSNHFQLKMKLVSLTSINFQVILLNLMLQIQLCMSSGDFKSKILSPNGINDKGLIYDTFDFAFKNDPSSFTNPKSLAYYFQTGYDLYKSGTKISLETLFESYEELTEKFELLKTNISKNIDIILKKEESGTPLTSREVRNKKIYDTNSNAVSAYLRLIDQRIAKEATCDILIPLYSKNFEENKNNPLFETKLFNKNLNNPIGMAAGFDKNAEVYNALFKLGFGFVEVGTITPLKQYGNPKPRVFRLVEDEALINRLGFNNLGAKNILDRIKSNSHVQ